jgi:hypothetical protein
MPAGRRPRRAAESRSVSCGDEFLAKMISTITREGNKLFEQYPGEDKVEFVPESETTFFLKGGDADSTRYTVVKNANGRVTHYVYRTYGSADRIATKIK